MAFQNVQTNVGSSIAGTKMTIGSSVEGYVVGTEPSLQNPENSNLLLKVADGTTIRFYTAGNLKYLIRDGKVATGLLTRITRIDDKNVKGKMSSQFTVEQDPEQTIDDAAFDAIFTPPTTSTEEPKRASTQGAVERNAVAARAAELAKAAKANKRA